MRLRILIILLLSCVTSHMAFSEEVNWDKGPLVWHDFRGTALLEGSRSFLATDIVMMTERVEGQRGENTFSMQSHAVMFPEKSYAPEAERTPERLRYFQAQFDLAEVLARRLQAELSTGMNGIEADNRLNYYRNLLKTEARRMEDDTNAGMDDERLQQTEYRLRQQLEELGMPAASEVEPGPLRYGFFLGTGFVTPLGDVADYFGTSWDFCFGLLFNYRRFGLEASITYANPTVRDPLLVENKYKDGNYRANVKNANYLAIGADLGFNVLDTKRFTIRPYVGGMWTSYSWTARPMAENNEEGIVFDGLQQRMSLNDFNLTFGCNLEWHFHSVVTRSPLFGNMREEFVSSLRVTPYAIRGCYDSASTPFKGWQFGVTVAYSGIGRGLRLK